MADVSDGAGMVDAAGERICVAFARVLRGAGVDVTVGNVTAFVEALGAVGMARRASVYWAGRATLVRRPEDHVVYDRAFDVFFGAAGSAPAAARHEERISVALDDLDDGPGDLGVPAPLTGPTIAVRYSPREVLRHKDFAAYSHAEFAEARRLMADLRLAGALKRSRRHRRSGRAAGRPDVRRTVRDALGHGGEPLRRAFLEPATRPRRVVLLCDVSGSMEPYTRALVRFLPAAVVGRARVEAFAMGTRLTRLTRQLRSRDPDAALAAAAHAVEDWAGGTRLGDGLRAFNDTWGVRGMARGAVVIVLSDGWDRGDPEELAEQMARLRRVAHRIIWVNPLKAAPGYAPLARGMAAALPYVDDFVEGHSLASLEALVPVVGGRVGGGKDDRVMGR
jgi:uncharacterized protein with von Willebrand factor type A (vWA) domain